MILVAGRFVYLAAPRTGSRTTCEALVKHCGGRKISRAHHASRAELEAMPYGRPVYSMIRDPADFVQAAFARHTCERFADFVTLWNPDSLGEWNGRITPYDGFVDWYFLFEDGLEAFFERVGYPGVPLSRRGRGETRTRKPLTAADEALLRERYAADFERYAYWQEKNRSGVTG